MSLHYVRDPCRTAYHKLSTLKQTGSVHQFKQALEELHFHMPKRSAECKLYDFIEGLKPHVREKIVVDFPESLEVAVRRALELEDNAREIYPDNFSKPSKNNGTWRKHCPEFDNNTQEAYRPCDSDGHCKRLLSFHSMTLSSCPSLEYKSSRMPFASRVTSASRGPDPYISIYS